MYIPFGEEGHVFIGEQSGPFTATFPEEIYDAEGNLIKKEHPNTPIHIRRVQPLPSPLPNLSGIPHLRSEAATGLGKFN